MIEGFLSALASSAGVFLGLLVLLLVNELLHYRERRGELDRQREQLDTQIAEWEQRKAEFEDERSWIEERRSERAREDAGEEFERFLDGEIYQILGAPPSEVSVDEIVEAFCQHLGFEDPDEVRPEYVDVATENIPETHAVIAIEEVREFADRCNDRSITSAEQFIHAYKRDRGASDIHDFTEKALREEFPEWRQDLVDPLSGVEIEPFIPPQLPKNQTAALADNQRLVEEKRRLSELSDRILRAETRIASLRARKDDVQERLDDLSVGPLYRILSAVALALTLSLLVPILLFLGMFFRFSVMPSTAVTAVVAFISWLGGFGVVLHSLLSHTQAIGDD